MENFDFLDPHNNCCDCLNPQHDYLSHPTSHDLDPTQGLHTGSSDLAQQLTVAYIAQGINPAEAALQAQLQAPLIEPYLL